MMQEVCGMNGMWEQAVARVDKEDKEQNGKQQGPELAGGANLRGTVSVLVCTCLLPQTTYNATGHGWGLSGIVTARAVLCLRNPKCQKKKQLWAPTDSLRLPHTFQLLCADDRHTLFLLSISHISSYSYTSDSALKPVLHLPALSVHTKIPCV
jgi:hypothetical protein